MDGTTSRTDLRLPKIPVEVELGFVGGDKRRAELFVAPHTEHAYRRQHLLDLLEGPAAFVPVHELTGAGEMVLVNKASLVFVAIPLTDGSLPVEEEPESFEPQLYDIQMVVRVDVVGHGSETGQVLYSPPAGNARVVDYLNQPGRFFRLWTADRLFLVNKDHVLRVSEQDSPGD